MKARDIALVGGSGFIGTCLTQLLLQAGHRVKILDIQNSKAFPELRADVDVRSAEDLARECAGCDVIYNLGAEHKDDVRPVSLYDDVNVQGARNVCTAAERLGIIEIIFTSSVAIYGFGQTELDEGADPNYINDYGRTKYEAEQVYLAWAGADPSRKLRIVRPTAVFGEGNRGNVYNLIRAIANKHFVMVGDGGNYKSIAYVGNVAAFLQYVLDLDGKPIEIFNYVDKPDLQMKELVLLVRDCFGFGNSMPIGLPMWAVYSLATFLDWVAAALNKSFPLSRVRIRKFCSNSQFLSQRVSDAGFKPSFNLQDALRQTIRAEFDL
jgi:GlcNAc-P-P-Und epimerase